MIVSRYIYRCADKHQAGNTLFFSTLIGSLISLNPTYTHLLDTDPDRLPEDVRHTLHDLGFLVESVDAESAKHRCLRATAAVAQPEEIEFIVETGLSCNLACGYCYENSYRDSRSRIFDVDSTVQQMKDVYSSLRIRPKSLHLSFIGGEPLIERDSIRRVIQNMRKWAERNSLRIETNVDTNGVLLRPDDATLFNNVFLAITPQRDQDQMRPFASGRGSFTSIMKSLQGFVPAANANTVNIQLRYNMHAGNIALFPAWLKEVDKLRIDLLSIHVAPLLNWPGNERVQPATRQAVSDAQLMALRYLVSSGRRIYTYPTPTHMPCSAYSLRTFKFLTDGSMRACDSDTEPSDQEQLNPRPLMHSRMQEFQNFNPMNDEDCKDCTMLPICGGKYFCRGTDEDSLIGTCDFLNYNLNDFLQFFITEYPKNPDLFVSV